MNARWYDAVITPLGWLGVDRARREVTFGVAGRVLEVGAGTGLNLPLYERPPDVVSDRVLDGLLAGGRVPRGVELIEADVEALPFDDASFDTVIGTLVFCSVQRPARGLAELFRVLRPGGELRLVEHVRAPGWRGRVLDALDVPWHALEGSCHLNRDTTAAVVGAGFVVERRNIRWGGVLETVFARRPVASHPSEPAAG